METAFSTGDTPTERRFTVEEYHRMGEAGILHEDDRVELLDGRLYAMPPIGSSHASRVDRLTRLLVLHVGDEATVRVQNPIRIGPDSEPEPDLALVDPNDETYRERHPQPEEVLLLVEVADATEDFDRSTKLSLYARAGISEYWVVSLPDERVYVHREPTEDDYGLRLTRKSGDAVTVAALPELAPILVDEILGA
jgi:Uma2 family endonuclease